MQVSILTFSITGNTKLAAKRIAAKITEGGKHTVTHISVVKLAKEIDAQPTNDGPLLAAARVTLSNSDVVALGCFSNTGHPSYAVNQVLSDSVLPRALFSKMKFFFVFATAGQGFARTLNVSATLLSNKNPEARYLGSLGLLAPENWPPLQPERPYRDAWRPSELTRAEEFGATIASYFDGAPIPPVTFSKAYTWGIITQNKFPRTLIVPRPECDRAKCQKCGTCVRKCPANAIKLSDDIEDGFPVFDLVKCVGCGRCFNTCPAEAIEMPKAHTKTRSRYPRPNLTAPEEKCDDGLISQAFPQWKALNARGSIGSERGLSVDDRRTRARACDWPRHLAEAKVNRIQTTIESSQLDRD
jgi:Pyruvate/2-oxoacid:ferredoxin oxidoreductase delta subunit